MEGEKPIVNCMRQEDQMCNDQAKDFNRAIDLKVLNESNRSFLQENKEENMEQKCDSENILIRETWGKKLDFILSCVGFSVGLGNVWRFPYLCYKNGGGVFLIPYIIFIAFGGVPLFFLELSLGQYMKQGVMGVWDICPLMKGLGVASSVVAFFINCYYIMVLTWALYYFALSFTSVLPWSTCNNPWNTEWCTTNFSQEYSNATEELSLAQNLSTNGSVTASVNKVPWVSPVTEFWEREVLQLSSGIDEPGTLRWQLVLCLLAAWIVCYVCICKGVKSTGKVVYFTALFPYVVLLCLLVRGVTLPGASDGIRFYLQPNWTKITEGKVWVDAGTQVFYSYAIGIGSLTALGSYSVYNNNCYRDCFILSIVNSATSFFSGFVTFSFLGFMAYEQNVPIADVAESGPGLAFLAYPKGVTLMPLSQFWSCLFFFMIFLIGLDSQFVSVEGLITAFMDVFPRLQTKRELLAALTCIMCFCVGLSMVTEGGMYVFQIFDYYSASGMTLLWMGLWECIAVAWLYGVNNYYKNIEDMIGYRPSLYMKWCWKYFTPIAVLTLLISTCVGQEQLVYNRTYIYPSWGIGLGRTISLSSMLCIPAVAIYKIFTTSGSLKQRIKKLLTPILQPHQLHKITEKY